MSLLFTKLIETVHPSWQLTVHAALQTLPAEYWRDLAAHPGWLPGAARLLAAFRVPRDAVEFILLGESPYPRALSANGYAFWDEAVQGLWSPTGLSTAVNRATSLRNFIKMLLVARGDLHQDTSQAAIARLDTRHYQQTARGLFQNLLARGVLLLNASLVYRAGLVRVDARVWAPFMQHVLGHLAANRPGVRVLAFGRIAEQAVSDCTLPVLIAEHPYNVSFIHNARVIHVFRPLDLLAVAT